jgi:hypothetical protein
MEGRLEREPSYQELKVEKAQKLKEYKQSLHLIVQLGLLSEKQRSSVQQNQYLNALEHLRENIEEFYRLMTEHEFQSIMFWEHDSEIYGWLDKTLNDDTCKPPRFPEKFTPADLERLIVRVYQAQTTISGVLEEIEPAYKRWLEYEDRCRKIWKAISTIDKEWQAEALFHTVVPPQVWIRIRRISEYVASLKSRMESLNNSQNVLSRLITLFQLTPATPMAREATLGNGQSFDRTPEVSRPPAESGTSSRFGGGRSFGRRS